MSHISTNPLDEGNQTTSNYNLATQPVETGYLINDILLELLNEPSNENEKYKKLYLKVCKDFHTFGLNSIPYLP